MIRSSFLQTARLLIPQPRLQALRLFAHFSDAKTLQHSSNSHYLEDIRNHTHDGELSPIPELWDQVVDFYRAPGLRAAFKEVTPLYESLPQCGRGFFAFHAGVEALEKRLAALVQKYDNRW
jgi:hypothetical protein